MKGSVKRMTSQLFLFGIDMNVYEDLLTSWKLLKSEQNPKHFQNYHLCLGHFVYTNIPFSDVCVMILYSFVA